MIRALLLTFLLAASGVTKSQLLQSFPQTNPGERIFGIVEDSVLNIAYVCGDFTSLGGINTAYLAAVDLNTNTVIPTFQPFFQCNGAITTLIKVNNYIYFGGTFTSLNNNASTPYLARLVTSPQGTTGTYDFTWTKGASAPIRQIKNIGNDVFIIGDHLVIDDGIDVRLNIAKINGANGITQNWDPSSVGSNPVHNWGSMQPRDLLIHLNKVFIGGKDLRPFNSSGVTCFDVSTGQYIPFDPVFSFPDVIDLEYLSGKVYAINSKFWPAGYGLLEIDENTFSVSPGAIPVNNGNPYGISTYRNALFVSGNYTSILNTTQSFLTRIEITPGGKTLSNWNPILNSGLNEEKSIHRIRDHLYICGTALNQTNGIPTNGIAQFCLEPFPIAGFQTAQLNVCQGDENIFYSCSPSRYADNYHWGYSGTGATFHPNANTATITFSSTATSGNVYVVAENDCGLFTDTLYLPITVNQTPTAFAGNDSTLTCTHTYIDLLGMSDLTPVSFSWTRPDGMILNQQNIPAIFPGIYALQVTDLNHGCTDMDSVNVSIDTLRPLAIPNQLSYTLTCTNPSQTLSGNSTPSNAFTWWRKYNGGTFPNPFQCDTIGNYFLVAQNTDNGCIDSVAITVTENKTPPAITLLSHQLSPGPVDTLTCTKDSIWLIGGTGGMAYGQWISNDTLINDSLLVIQPGTYQFQTIEPTNGCFADLFVQVDQWISPPVFQLQDSIVVNCSIDSTELTLSAMPFGTMIMDSNNNTINNPVFLVQPGWYNFTAQHPHTGCTTTDSLELIRIPEWNIWTINDTTICAGQDLSLSLQGNFQNIVWSDLSSGYSNQFPAPVPDTIVVEAIGTNGCAGRDTLFVEKQTIQIDSIQLFSTCDPNNPLLELNVFSNPQNLFCLIGNALFSTSSLQIAYSDTLALSLISSENCRLDTTLISPEIHLPEIDFLLASLGTEEDTFALVNLSQPLPDSFFVSVFPSATIVQDSLLPLIIFADTGTYEVTLHILNGECYNELSKTVLIKDPSNTRTNKHWKENIQVYPNPFQSSFKINLSLPQRENISVCLTDMLGKELYNYSTNDYYFNREINAQEIPFGPLLLMVSVGQDQTAIPLIHVR